MADLNPATTQRPVDDVYRPISGWAIAGFALAALYAALVAVTTIIALVRREPFFLPGWFVLAPVAAAVISFIGQKQVRDSEGTCVGLGLARWGLLLSIVVGVGYFAYSLFTGMALTKQAGDFLMVKSGADSGYFPLLQQGRKDPTALNAAFLLTLPARDRQGLSPDNEAELRSAQDVASKEGLPGPLTNFRVDKLNRAIMQGGPTDTQIESLGTQQWYYDKGAYNVERRYRIATPEAVYDVIVPVQTSRDQDGERKWFVNMPNIQIMSEDLTKVGQSLFTLRLQLRQWLMTEWIRNLNRGESLANFADLDRSPWSTILPGEEQRKLVQQAVTDLFTGTQVNRISTLKFLDIEKRTPWVRDQGRLRLQQDFILDIVLPNGKRYFLAGDVVAQTKEQVDLESPPPAVTWEVVELKIVHAGMVDAAVRSN